MSSTIKIKRSNVPGKVPTTSDIASGELALNTKDFKLYSSNGTSIFQLANALALANTNASITNVKTNLTSTNTALRLLISNISNANVIVSSSLVSALTQNDTVVTSLTDISHAYTLTEQVVLDQYLQVANSFTKLTKYAANTSAVTTSAGSLTSNSPVVSNPAGLITLQLPDASTIKLPDWT